jgi:hypothetical protein
MQFALVNVIFLSTFITDCILKAAIAEKFVITWSGFELQDCILLEKRDIN